MIKRCPLCGGAAAQPVFTADMPLRIMGSLHDPVTSEPFVPFALVACTVCGHLYNQAFDAAHMDAVYGDAPLTNVPVHPSMMERLRGLLEWLGPDAITGRDVVEIGSGSGHLARLLATQARSVRLFEPNRNLTGAMLPEANITLVNAPFPCDIPSETVDFVFCRQVLEHVIDPFTTLLAIRASMRAGGRAYLEVPNARYIVQHGAFADLHTQHVQYFDPDGFAALAARAGLRRLKTLDIKGGHDFGILFEADDPVASALHHTDLNADALALRLASRLAAARCVTDGMTAPVALYGATAQGQAFVNAVSFMHPIGVVFDDNLALDGYGLFDSTRRFAIQPPKPDQTATLVILAYLHDEAIAQSMRSLGYRGQIWTIRPTPIPSGTGDLTAIFDDRFS